MKQEKKGRASALLPIGIFLVIFIGAGIISNDFIQCLPLWDF